MEGWSLSLVIFITFKLKFIEKKQQLRALNSMDTNKFIYFNEFNKF